METLVQGDLPEFLSLDRQDRRVTRALLGYADPRDLKEIRDRPVYKDHLGSRDPLDLRYIRPAAIE